jgi:hypothetical protein
VDTNGSRKPIVEPNPRLKGLFMPDFRQKAAQMALSAAIFAGMVIAPFIAAKHIYHEYCTNIHRSNYHINSDRFDRFNTDHTRKEIV